MVWLWMLLAAIAALLLLILYPKVELRLYLEQGVLKGVARAVSTIGSPLISVRAWLADRSVYMEIEAPFFRRKMRAKWAALLLSRKRKMKEEPSSGGKASQAILKHAVFKKIWLDARLAGKDAAQVALSCAALRLAVQQADWVFAQRHPKALRKWQVDADFQSQRAMLEVGCIARLWIWHIIAAAITAKRKKGS